MGDGRQQSLRDTSIATGAYRLWQPLRGGFEFVHAQARAVREGGRLSTPDGRASQWCSHPPAVLRRSETIPRHHPSLDAQAACSTSPISDSSLCVIIFLDAQACGWLLYGVAFAIVVVGGLNRCARAAPTSERANARAAQSYIITWRLVPP